MRSKLAKLKENLKFHEQLEEHWSFLAKLKTNSLAKRMSREAEANKHLSLIHI